MAHAGAAPAPLPFLSSCFPPPSKTVHASCHLFLFPCLSSSISSSQEIKDNTSRPPLFFPA